MRFEGIKQKVIKEIDSTLEKVQQVDELVGLIISSRRIFVVGAGRTKLMLEAFAQRLNHLGINAHVVGEVIQPSASEKDLLIVASGSGRSIFPFGIAKKARKIGMNIVLITAQKNSSISGIADVIIRIPAPVKFGSHKEESSLQPLGSLFEQSLLIFCDIVAFLIEKKKGFSRKQLQKYHANLE